MTIQYRWFVTISLLIIAALVSLPAKADYFSSWVGVTCDASSSQAAVRFGYADADAVPYFALANASIDNGPTAAKPAHPDQREASCDLPGGRQVKVRLASGYAEGDSNYTVWIDKIAVIHGLIDDSDTNDTTLPVVVLVSRKGYQICSFQVPAIHLYDVTDPSKPLPIVCDHTISQVTGDRDVAEYPITQTHAPVAGSLRVSGSESELCKQMLVPIGLASPGTLEVGAYAFSNDEGIVGSQIGSVTKTYDFDRVENLTGSRDPNTFVSVKRLDLYDTGKPIPVYAFSSGGTYPTVFLVVPPINASEADIRGLWQGKEFEEVADGARKHDWAVFSAAQTAYQSMDRIELDILHSVRGTFLLWYPGPGGDDPAAILVKPYPAGSTETVCTFVRVPPHF